MYGAGFVPVATMIHSEKYIPFEVLISNEELSEELIFERLFTFTPDETGRAEFLYVFFEVVSHFISGCKGSSFIGKRKTW